MKFRNSEISAVLHLVVPNVEPRPAEHIKRQEQASLSGVKEAHGTHIMNQIQEQEFFEESEGFMYGPRTVD